MSGEWTAGDYVDGRLDAGQRAAFERRMAADPALAREVRLLKAMKASLKGAGTPMPGDLKAALKRRAREGRLPFWRRAWESLLDGGAWTYGTAAAAAAAGFLLAARLGGPGAEPGAPVARGGAPAAETPAAAVEELRELWSEDDGRDEDEG